MSSIVIPNIYQTDKVDISFFDAEMVNDLLEGEKCLANLNLNQAITIGQSAIKSIGSSNRKSIPFLILLGEAYLFLDQFVDLVVVENVQDGRYLKKVKNLPKESNLLIEGIARVLEAGGKQGVLRKDVDPFQFYVSVLSLSFFHLSNASTLSIMYQRKVNDKDWIAERRAHVIDMVLGFLRP